MATTIRQSFATLKSNLEITSLQSTTVSTRQRNVRDAVEAGLQVEDSFLTGSYSRSTMITPLKDADVDIFVVLNPKYFHNYNGQNGGPAGLLDTVKRTILRTYATTPNVSRNGQAVTIRFSDFAVDVVPGFNRQGGGYLIPNSITNSWLSTDPKKHVELMAASNRIHNGYLVPLIKMIKAWNRAHSAFFRSFHLEVLALEILNNIRIDDFSSGARFYFDKGREFIKKQNLDPAGYGDDVGRYITSDKVEEAHRRFQLAYDRAIKAEALAGRGNMRDAVDMWTINFGTYFPAYG
jgi:Second Messenger Oligonucleotide or Dinucleotide Synthetase domain